MTTRLVGGVNPTDPAGKTEAQRKLPKTKTKGGIKTANLKGGNMMIGL